LQRGWLADFPVLDGGAGQPIAAAARFLLLVRRVPQRLQSIDFEQLRNPELASDAGHLEAWRDHRIVYHLFATRIVTRARRSMCAPLRALHAAARARRGIRLRHRPLLVALARRYRHLDLQLVGTDSPHLLFHYARCRLRDCPS
jgi:hypothetical protein